MSHLRHGKSSPAVGSSPVKSAHVILCNIVISMIPEAGALILQILDMPVPLV